MNDKHQTKQNRLKIRLNFREFLRNGCRGRELSGTWCTSFKAALGTVRTHTELFWMNSRWAEHQTPVRQYRERWWYGEITLQEHYLQYMDWDLQYVSRKHIQLWTLQGDSPQGINSTSCRQKNKEGMTHVIPMPAVLCLVHKPQQ